MALYEFKIATYAAGVAGLTNIESLATPVTPPRWFYRPDVERKKLANGLVRALGLPTAEWRWGVITRAERDILRTYCTSASTHVYIRTKTANSSDAYANFLAVMIWPEEEEVDATRRLDFVIRFEHLEVQT